MPWQIINLKRARGFGVICMPLEKITSMASFFAYFILILINFFQFRLDNTHTATVDQWDWEVRINKEQKNINFLKETGNYS